MKNLKTFQYVAMLSLLGILAACGNKEKNQPYQNALMGYGQGNTRVVGNVADLVKQLNERIKQDIKILESGVRMACEYYCPDQGAGIWNLININIGGIPLGQTCIREFKAKNGKLYYESHKRSDAIFRHHTDFDRLKKGEPIPEQSAYISEDAFSVIQVSRGYIVPPRPWCLRGIGGVQACYGDSQAPASGPAPTNIMAYRVAAPMLGVGSFGWSVSPDIPAGANFTKGKLRCVIKR